MLCRQHGYVKSEPQQCQQKHSKPDTPPDSWTLSRKICNYESGDLTL